MDILIKLSISHFPLEERNRPDTTKDVSLYTGIIPTKRATRIEEKSVQEAKVT
jgi:hypothetical protein